jgi:ankyrin repeat protein
MDSHSLRFITHHSFFSALRSGNLDSVKRLVDELTGDNPSDGSAVADLMALQNDAGETALYVAAENNLLDLFRYLLKFSDIQTLMIRSKSDMDALHVAAKHGHLGILLELLLCFGFSHLFFFSPYLIIYYKYVVVFGIV